MYPLSIMLFIINKMNFILKKDQKLKYKISIDFDRKLSI